MGRFLPEENTWVMAFDFGLSRIGVAIANTLLKIPHPVECITGKNKFEKFEKTTTNPFAVLDQVSQQQNVRGVVIDHEEDEH